jgi:BTB/POZ domain
MPNAYVILQSSNLVNFRVHRSVLVASSPFFADMFSLPQPQNDTAPNGLPVEYLYKDAEVLNSLISILYPVPPNVPLQRQYLISARCRRKIRHGESPILDPRGDQSQRVAVVNSCRNIPCIGRRVQQKAYSGGGDRSPPHTGPLTDLQVSVAHYGCSKVRHCATSLNFACAAYISFAQIGGRSQTDSAGLQKFG